MYEKTIIRRRRALGLSITGVKAQSQKVKVGDIPTTTFGKTGVKVSVIAQGGARMDLHPDIQTAAAHVRKVYDLGVTYFDCARAYWNGRSEEAYGIGLQDVRKMSFSRPKRWAHRQRSRAGFGKLVAFAEDRPC
ncbi:MAG: aldo/keto reductase [Acidobacteria bacterium]|nr:aldo/keto reductase [Acidobacteriota bacterium]